MKKERKKNRKREGHARKQPKRRWREKTHAFEGPPSPVPQCWSLAVVLLVSFACLFCISKCRRIEPLQNACTLPVRVRFLGAGKNGRREGLVGIEGTGMGKGDRGETRLTSVTVLYEGVNCNDMAISPSQRLPFNQSSRGTAE